MFFSKLGMESTSQIWHSPPFECLQKRFCRHSKPSKLPNPQGITKGSPNRHIDEVPILLPDDVLLPFFIRLGYTNLQDLLLSPESNAIKRDQMR